MQVAKRRREQLQQKVCQTIQDTNLRVVARADSVAVAHPRVRSTDDEVGTTDGETGAVYWRVSDDVER